MSPADQPTRAPREAEPTTTCSSSDAADGAYIPMPSLSAWVDPTPWVDGGQQDGHGPESPSRPNGLHGRLRSL